MKRGYIKTGLIILTALGAYFITGLLMDLPPYGILLKHTESVISVSDGEARVESSLTYYCRSWHPVKSEYFLPFPGKKKDETPPDFTAALSGEGASYEVFPEGVILRLDMKPKENRQVDADFTFMKKTDNNEISLNFTRMNGWFAPAENVSYTVIVLKGFDADFSLKPLNVERLKDTTKYSFLLENRKDPGLTVRWKKYESKGEVQDEI